MLLTAVDQKLAAGASEFVLLISTVGGTVFHGLTTYNIGSVDSIGVTLFCAGTSRRSVPNARFMIHEVSITLAATLDDRGISNQLKNLRIDAKNVAGVMAANTGKSVEEVEAAMLA